MLIAVRILIGISQAGAYPAAAIVLKRWVPASNRARASSYVTTGGRFGWLLAFAITPLLASVAGNILGWQTGAWRVVFAGYGAMTVLWAVWFWISFRNRPDEHPACNLAERELIAQALPVDSRAAAPPKPLSFSMWTLATSPSLWFLSLINILQNIGWIFLVTWLTQYLIEHYEPELLTLVQQPQNLAGPLTALTGLAAMVGNLIGGVVSDVSVGRLGKRWGRRVSGILAGALAGSMYLIAWGSGNLWVTVAVMAGASFFADLAIGSMWATLQDIGGRNVGSILGFTNMCGNLAAAAAAWWFGYLAEHNHWPAVFMISALSFFAVAACWLGIDASRPLAPEEGIA
jgi:nitrate/nitrite transporter NarK